MEKRLAFLMSMLVAFLTNQSYSRTPGDQQFFTAATLSRHVRTGYLDLGSGKTEKSAPVPMVTYGLSAGRNFRLSEAFRIGVPVVFEYGMVREETFSDILLQDGTYHLVNLNAIMYHAGIQPQLQFPVKLTTATWFYGAVGGGVHYAKVTEEEKTQDSPHLWVSDKYLENSSGTCVSALAGIGYERSLSTTSGFYLQYMFKYWCPVSKKTTRDLFPLTAKSYHERFLTHSITLGFMFLRQH